MVILKKRENKHNPTLRLIKTGGYLVLLGMFIGMTLEVYSLFNPPLFSIFNNISHYEAISFFLGLYMPSFIIIVAIGYVFATIPKLERFNLWRTATLCSLALLCLALSALSILNILSFLGGIIILMALISTHTKPTFKVFWKREACFFVETGTILMASSSMLFLLMLLISGFFRTYSAGVYEASYSYPYFLLLMVVLSLLTFLLTPFLCLHGANVGLCGIIDLTMGVLSFITIIRNQYVYFHQSVYQGIFLAGIGTILILIGALTNFILFFSEIPSPTLEPSSLYKGNYCPYCGERWVNADKVFCSTCGRNLFWKLEKSFCPYCGRLIIQDIENCPHCGEYVASLPVYISSRKSEEEKSLMEMGKVGKPGKLQKTLDFLSKHANKTLARIELSFTEEFPYLCVLISLFVFLSFFVCVRREVIVIGMDEYIVFHYGFPLEWLEFLKNPRAWSSYSLFPLEIRVNLIGAVLDFVLCFLLAFAIVYASRKLYDYIA